MIVLRDPQQLVQSDIKAYLQQRFHDLEDGFFILVEPGDTAEQIESATGYGLLKSQCNGNVYGDPGFTPDCEYVQEHRHFYEAVYLITDSGDAAIVIVPKEEGIDSRILAVCEEFATPIHPKPHNLDVVAFVQGLDSNAREYFEERAGIAEFEAGMMSRADSEQFAVELTQARFKL